MRIRYTVFGALCSCAISSVAAVRAEEVLGHESNHASLILANTNLLDEAHSGLTVGMDFEHEVTDRFGVGFVAEHAFGSVRATSLFTVVDIHLGNGFVIQTGPGVEFESSHTSAAARIGIFYEIEVGDFILAPMINYDVSEQSEALVTGLALGTRF